eukprot:scaffold633_cov288-Ochromonas_danica.AAC.88
MHKARRKGEEEDLAPTCYVQQIVHSTLHLLRGAAVCMLAQLYQGSGGRQLESYREQHSDSDSGDNDRPFKTIASF